MRHIFSAKNAQLLFCTIAIAICSSNISLRAQVTSGTIYGTVKDNTGAVVPNAAVTVRGTQIGITRTTTIFTVR